MNMSNNDFFFARVFSDTNLYKVHINSDQVFKYGAEVIIKTEFGNDIAVITSFPTNKDQFTSKSYLSGTLISYATIEDRDKRKALDKKSLIIKAKVNTLIDELKLNMNLTHVLIPLSEDSICIYYTAKDRVDFRNLLIELKKSFKMKVVMRQINKKERSSSFLSSSDLSLYNGLNRREFSQKKS